MEWTPIMNLPPGPVHIDERATVAPMQKALSSPTAKNSPVIKTPAATIQMAPITKCVRDPGKINARVHNTAIAVIAMIKDRKLK